MPYPDLSRVMFWIGFLAREHKLDETDAAFYPGMAEALDCEPDDTGDKESPGDSDHMG